MIDILAMGGVPVMDDKPPSLWPEPLAEGSHYLNLGLSAGREITPRTVADKIDSWLQSASLIPSISRNTADYFDRFLAPDKLGASILRTVQDRRPLRAGQ
jgi:hypothetical protein